MGVVAPGEKKNLAQDMDIWMAVVVMVTNLRVL